MKKTFLVLILNSLFISLLAQNFEWAKREGLYAYDYGYGITNDKSGNIYLAGKYEMNSKFSGTTVSCEGNHDIYVAKYTPSGSLSWIRTAGGYTGDYATCIACDGTYVYIGGEIEGSNALIKFSGSPITLTCQGSNDIMLAKYDLNGNLIWAKRAGDAYYDKARGISYDAAGNVYIVGLFNKTATFGGTTTITGYGDNDIFVAKYDANGNFLWVKKAGGSGRDEGKAIKCDAAGNIYICGMYKGSANFGGQNVSSPDAYWNMFVAKYSTDGTFQWVKTAGGNWDDEAWGITMDDAGKIYVTGEYNSPINFGGISLSSSGRADVFVTCYNSSGTALWAKKAGGSGLDRARAIGTDGSNLYITGQFGGTATFGSTTLYAADGADIFNACLDNNGNFKWANSVGGAPDAPEDLGYESGDAICADGTGNVYSSGALLDGGTFGSTSLTTYGRTDIFLTKIKTSATPSTCPAPSGLTTTSVTTTSATLNWSAVSSALSYDVQYRKTGTASWITSNTTVNSTVISGLTLATTYEFQVRTNCSSALSSFSPINSFTTTGTGSINELISSGTSWKYLDNGTNQGTAWRTVSFADATWKTGNAEFGYGDGDEATVVSYGPSSTNKYITTYFRKTFNVLDKSIIASLELNLIRDDGAVVYINGIEVYRSNLPEGTISYNTLASTNISGANGSTYLSANIPASSLVNGTNIIAVEIHQYSISSADISFNLKLNTLATAVPGNATELFPANSSWKYLDNGTNQGSDWKAPLYSDAAWKTGNAELGYGDGGEATVVSYGASSTNKYITTYFRKTFDIVDKSSISGLELSLIRDDGAVVYINGIEVYRNNLPSGIIYYNTLAPNYIDGINESTFVTANISSSSLVNGTNLIAVEIHQNSVTSSDISFNLKLKTLSGSKIMDIKTTVDSPQQNIILENTVDMIVYPNPTTGQFNLELCIDDLEEKNVVIEVTNSFGKVVYKKQAQKINGCVKEAIELEANLPLGVYLLKVTIDDKIQTSKMLLTR